MTDFQTKILRYFEDGFMIMNLMTDQNLGFAILEKQFEIESQVQNLIFERQMKDWVTSTPRFGADGWHFPWRTISLFRESKDFNRAFITCQDMITDWLDERAIDWEFTLTGITILREKDAIEFKLRWS